MTQEQLDAIRDEQMRIARGALRRIEDRTVARRTPSVFEQFEAAHRPPGRPQGWPIAVETAQGGSAPVARNAGPIIAARRKRQVTVAERNRGLTC